MWIWCDIKKQVAFKKWIYLIPCKYLEACEIQQLTKQITCLLRGYVIDEGKTLIKGQKPRW